MPLMPMMITMSAMIVMTMIVAASMLGHEPAYLVGAARGRVAKSHA